MNYSPLLEKILIKEKEIRNKLQQAYSSHETLFYAYLSYFKKLYLVLDDRNDDYPLPFEEERMYLLLEKVLVRSINLSERVFSAYSKQTINSYDYIDELNLDELVRERNQAVISADLLFAYTLYELDDDHKKPIQPKYRSIEPLDLLNEIDSEIYPYVMKLIENEENLLQEKRNKVIYYRDYKPKPCFVDEKTLLEFLNANIYMEEEDRRLHIIIPHFFKDSKDYLELFVIRKGNMYYVHDRGCAFRELNKHISSKEECREKIHHYLSGTIAYLHEDVVIGSLNSLSYFARYLQRLIMIANLHLIDGIYKHMPEKDREIIYPFVKGEDDLEEFKDYIKSMFSVSYDKNEGLIIGARYCYIGNMTTASYKLETNGTQVTIKDYYNRYLEGAIFENLWFNNESIIAYKPYIYTIASYFGGYYDGQEVVLTFTYTNQESFIIAFYNFIQMAILLAPMDTLFDLECIEKKYKMNSFN